MNKQDLCADGASAAHPIHQSEDGGSQPTSALQSRVVQIPTEEARPWILNKHYARRMPCVQFAFGLYENGENVPSGIVTFGPTPTPAVQQNICGEKYSSIVFELNRLCIDSRDKNAASFLVGHALKLLPKPAVIVSYADEGQGHKGYIYQATNFLYTGAVTAHDSEYIVNGVKTHARSITSQGITAVKEWANKNGIEQVKPKPKHRYVMFLGSKKQREELRTALTYRIVSKYPKGESRRYDASAEVVLQTVML